MVPSVTRRPVDPPLAGVSMTRLRLQSSPPMVSDLPEASWMPTFAVLTIAPSSPGNDFNVTSWVTSTVADSETLPATRSTSPSSAAAMASVSVV